MVVVVAARFSCTARFLALAPGSNSPYALAGDTRGAARRRPLVAVVETKTVPKVLVNNPRRRWDNVVGAPPVPSSVEVGTVAVLVLAHPVVKVVVGVFVLVVVVVVVNP